MIRKTAKKMSWAVERARRREELARLSGGDVTAVMLDGAEELLTSAEKLKAGARKKHD